MDSLGAVPDQGALPYRLVAGASTNLTNVKSTKGRIQSINVSNAGVITYLHIYDKATAPIVGTDTPKATYLCAVNQNTPVDLGAHGIQCTLGIGFSLSTAMDGTGAVLANACVVNLTYS